MALSSSYFATAPQQNILFTGRELTGAMHPRDAND
jgi:hypothetical protein